jgi:hypothetical protein
MATVVNHLPFQTLTSMQLQFGVDKRIRAAECIVTLNELGYFESLKGELDKACVGLVNESLALTRDDIMDKVTSLRIATQLVQGFQETAARLLKRVKLEGE